MDAALVGGLTAAASLVALAAWMMFARPDATLDLWSDRPLTDAGWGEQPDTVPWIQALLGAFVLAAGFAIGLALAFLARTG